MSNKEGYYNGRKDDLLDGRYVVEKRLGNGTFGSVYYCTNTDGSQPVAIKVIRNIPKYKEAGYRELETLRLVETQQCRHVVRLLDSFEFQGHVALVFPLYGCTLLELLRANEFRGFNLDWTRELARCVLVGIKALHDVGRVHTDVKPENIMTRRNPISTPVRGRMFVHPAGADLVLIDLGSAVAVDRPRPLLVCTR